MNDNKHHFERHVTIDEENISSENGEEEGQRDNATIAELENEPEKERKINAVDILAEATHLSRHTIKQAMQKGAVWLTRGEHTQRLRRAKKTLQAGDCIHLYYDEKILSESPPPSRLLADEDDYSIWYKPYGIYCQGSKWGDHCTINRYAEQQLQRPAFIIHRLDRAATGLIIIGHKKTSTAQLARLFEQRAIDKRYQAIVQGHFPADETALRLHGDIDGKNAVSHVRSLSHKNQPEQTLVTVSIETGRKHQIRRHLAEAGYPIVGDRLYGEASLDDEENLQLCSYELAFTCPITGTSRHYVLPTELLPHW